MVCWGGQDHIWVEVSAKIYKRDCNTCHKHEIFEDGKWQ